MEERTAEPRSIFVTDFDGTMSHHDFYRLVIEKLLPSDYPDQWADYRSGRITHFEALKHYFAGIRATPEVLNQMLADMKLDPEIPHLLDQLHANGWQVLVASAGCDWYIHKLLDAAGITLEVHANPGYYDPEKGLVMERPTHSRYFSERHGIDKAAIVREAKNRVSRVAFAGDGFPDAEAARLVPDQYRFARADLAQVLSSEGRSYIAFERWTEVANHLLRQGAS